MTHRNNFDALRLIAALSVMTSHAFYFSGRPQPTPYAGQTLGTFAVFVFFAISGFLVTQSWNSDPDIRRFTARRMLRIAPAYMVTISLTLAVLFYTGIDEFTMNPVALPNGSLWTIPIEIVCYLALMILAAITKHGGVAMLIACRALGADSYIEQFGAIFALGSMMGQYAVLRRWYGYLGLIGIGLLMIPPHHIFWAIVFILTPVTVWVGSQSWPVVRDIGAKGDFSYGVYLYACPAQQFVVMWFGKDSNPMILLLAAVALVAPFACMSWFLIESPALKLKPRRQAVGS